MMSCVVSSCKSNSLDNPDLSFFNFPKHNSMRQEWLEVLNLKRSHVSDLTRICELHFRQMDICAGKKSLKTHAVPIHISGRRDESSEEEFVQCGSDSDPDIIEVKKISQRDVISKVKSEENVKREPSDDEVVKEPEPESGRRPSRRAAQLAVKKIHNSVRNLALPTSVDIPLQREVPKIEMKVKRGYAATQGLRKRIRDQRIWHSIRIPPADLDLMMECHEELLSTVQMDALVRAQTEYNNVMKRLRTLRSTNARIICMTSDETETLQVKQPSPPPAKASILKTITSAGIRSPNVVTLSPASLTHNTQNTITVLPVRLLAVHSSSGGSQQVKKSPTVTLTATSEVFAQTRDKSVMSGAERARQYRERQKAVCAVAAQPSTSAACLSTAHISQWCDQQRRFKKVPLTNTERQRKYRERRKAVCVAAAQPNNCTASPSTAFMSKWYDQQRRFNKKVPLTNTERQRRYRERRKAIRAKTAQPNICHAGPSTAYTSKWCDQQRRLKKVPLTNTERQRRYRQRKKAAHSETYAVARQSATSVTINQIESSMDADIILVDETVSAQR